MKFTKRSFHFSIFTLVLLAIFLVLSTIERTRSNTGMNDVTAFLITLFFVTVIVGFIMSLISFTERYSFKQVFSAVVNIGLFLVLSYYVVQNLADVSKIFG